MIAEVLGPASTEDNAADMGAVRAYVALLSPLKTMAGLLDVIKAHGDLEVGSICHCPSRQPRGDTNGGSSWGRARQLLRKRGCLPPEPK